MPACTYTCNTDLVSISDLPLITPPSLLPCRLYKHSPESEILDRNGRHRVIHPGAAVGKDVHVQSWTLHCGQIHGSADGALGGEEGLILQTARKKRKKEEVMGGNKARKNTWLALHSFKELF